MTKPGSASVPRERRFQWRAASIAAGEERKRAGARSTTGAAPVHSPHAPPPHSPPGLRLPHPLSLYVAGGGRMGITSSTPTLFIAQGGRRRQQEEERWSAGRRLQEQIRWADRPDGAARGATTIKSSMWQGSGLILPRRGAVVERFGKESVLLRPTKRVLFASSGLGSGPSSSSSVPILGGRHHLLLKV